MADILGVTSELFETGNISEIISNSIILQHNKW